MALWDAQVIAKGFNPADFKWFPMLDECINPTTGLIGQNANADLDQGDTLNREGHVMTTAAILHGHLKLMSDNEYRFLCERYEGILKKLQDPKDWSNYARTDLPGYWGSTYQVMSRDQATPNITAFGLNNMWSRTLKAISGHAIFRALLFTTNVRNNWAYPGTPDYAWKLPDVTFIGYWGLYVRSLWGVPLWPLLVILDLDLVVNALIKVYSYGKDPTNTDDINFLASLALAYYRLPTPLSWLARKIYAKRPLAQKPPPNNPEDIRYDADTNTVQVVINAYFRFGDPKNGPLLNEWWRPIIADMFK